jgi:hypothetical protein
MSIQLILSMVVVVLLLIIKTIVIIIIIIIIIITIIIIYDFYRSSSIPLVKRSDMFISYIKTGNQAKNRKFLHTRLLLCLWQGQLQICCRKEWALRAEDVPSPWLFGGTRRHVGHR